MRSIISNTYNWAIGEDIVKEKQAYRKAKVLINAHLIVIGLTVFGIFSSLFLIPLNSLIFSFILLAYSFSVWTFKKWQSFLVSGNSFIAICMISTLFMIYNYGGYQSTYMLWLLIIPIYSFSLATRTSAFYWFGITLAAIFGVLFFFPSEITLPVSDSLLKIIKVINMLAFFGFVFSMEYLAHTEREELIEELDFEHEQNKAILDRIPAGLAYIDNNLTVVYYNPVLAKFFKLSPKGAIGKSISEIIPERYYKINLPYYLRALEGETVTYERFVGSKDQPLFIRCTYVPRFNKKGEVIGFVNLIADLTKMKETERLKLEAKEAQKIALSNTIGFRNRELASQELFITNQKELLKEIKQSLGAITKEIDPKPKTEVKKIIRSINQNINLGDEWENFRAQFERIHPDFIERLQSRFSKLNTRELRHCSYLRMRLSNKEIARIQNLSLKSIEMTNYRLKKKLALDTKVMLPQYILSF